METKIDFKQNNIIYICLCLLFVLTVQQFDLFKGNILYLIHAIKELDENNLQNDWIANQTDHLPLFTFLNYLLILHKFRLYYIIFLFYDHYHNNHIFVLKY